MWTTSKFPNDARKWYLKMGGIARTLLNTAASHKQLPVVWNGFHDKGLEKNIAGLLLQLSHLNHWFVALLRRPALMIALIHSPDTNDSVSAAGKKLARIL